MAEDLHRFRYPMVQYNITDVICFNREHLADFLHNLQVKNVLQY